MQNVTLGCQTLQWFWHLLAAKLDVLWMVTVIAMSGTSLQQVGRCKVIYCMFTETVTTGRQRQDRHQCALVTSYTDCSLISFTVKQI